MNTNTILHGKRVATLTLGCKVNQYETEGMRELLEAAGCQFVAFEEEADIYLVNTCSVTNIAERKSRQMLHKAKKENSKATVVAVGCYVETGIDGVKKDECIDLAVGNNKKSEIVDILNEFMGAKADLDDKTLNGSSIIDINNTHEYENMTLTQMPEHTRAYIKIQDGCNQFCSYCAIPLARGRVRSRGEAEILQEIRGMVKAGYREGVLTGIHISSYGIDLDGQHYAGSSRLIDLIEISLQYLISS